MRKVFVDVKVNNQLISLDSYNATLVGYDFAHTSPTVGVINSMRGVMQIIGEDYTYNPDEGYIQFLIEGKNHETVDYTVRKIIGDLVNFDFHISSQLYWRTFVQTSTEVKWINYERKAIVTLHGSSYCWGYEKQVDITKNGQEFFVDTPRPTPLIYKIEALQNVQNIIIDGMKILSLSKGEVMVIDAYHCRVTVGNEGAMHRVSIYDFPLKKGIHKVSVNDISKIKLKISWRARL